MSTPDPLDRLPPVIRFRLETLLTKMPAGIVPRDIEHADNGWTIKLYDSAGRLFGQAGFLDEDLPPGPFPGREAD